MGFLGDFVGGAADAGAGIIANQIKTNQQTEAAQALAKFNADLDIAKQQTITANTLKAQNDNADLLRNQQVARINDAAQPIIQGMQVKKINALYGPESNLQASDIDQSEFDNVPLSADEQAQARLQAGAQTGDIPISMQAQLSQRSDAANNMLMAKLNHDDTIAQIGAGHDDTKLMVAGMMQALKAQGGNTDFERKVALLKKNGASDAEIANFILDRKQPSIEDLANGFLKADPNAGGKNAMTVDAALQKAIQLRALAKPQAPASPSADVPQGLTIVGHTGDGKIVYQDASGKKYTQ